MQAYTIRAKDVRLRPTAHGLVFGLMVAAMTLGSLNYHNNMGLLLAFLLGGMATVSLLHTFKNLTGLQILSIAVRPVFAGEAAEYELQVRSEGTVGRSLGLSFLQSGPSVQDMLCGVPERVSLRVPTQQRGWHDPGPLQIETRYPFGLLRLSARVRLDVRCLVYPKPVGGPLDAVQACALSRGSGAKEHPGMDDFSALRPYQPGEPVEHIYWKAFSREQGLQIKKFSAPAGSRIVFDFDSVKGGGLEHKLSLLCGAVLQAHRVNLSYGLNLPGVSIPAAMGDIHRRGCLKALALFPASAHPDAP